MELNERRLKTSNGRWATLSLQAPPSGGEAALESMLRRLEPHARSWAQEWRVESRFYYLKHGPAPSLQLVLVLDRPPGEREGPVLELGRAGELWRLEGWAADYVFGFMDIEKSLEAFAGADGLQAVERMEAALSRAVVDASTQAPTLRRLPGRALLAAGMANAVLDSTLKSADEKARSAALWSVSYARMLERDNLSPEPSEPPPPLPASELNAGAAPWQALALARLRRDLEVPGLALRAAALPARRFDVLADVLWRRTIHQSWGRLGFRPAEETLLLEWLRRCYAAPEAGS